jgi:hypothetical protein
LVSEGGARTLRGIAPLTNVGSLRDSQECSTKGPPGAG